MLVEPDAVRTTDLGEEYAPATGVATGYPNVEPPPPPPPEELVFVYVNETTEEALLFG